MTTGVTVRTNRERFERLINLFRVSEECLIFSAASPHRDCRPWIQNHAGVDLAPPASGVDSAWVDSGNLCLGGFWLGGSTKFPLWVDFANPLPGWILLGWIFRTRSYSDVCAYVPVPRYRSPGVGLCVACDARA